MCRRTTITALLLTLLGTLPRCSRSADGELVVLSPHSPEIRAEFSRGFGEWYQARRGRTVTIKWLDVGGTGEAIEYVRSRNARGKRSGGVDVFFGGGDYPFMKLRAMDLLAPCHVADTILSRIPSTLNGVALYEPGGYWYGAALSGFGIIYNKEIARRNGLTVPVHWEDLARPACRGWIASADPRYSGSMHMMYEILLQAYGWERGWEVILRMGANVQSFAKGASIAAKEVSLGQAAFGLAIDFYAFIEIERYGADRLGFVLPEGETIVNPDGIGVLKNAANHALAADFVTYVLSAGQKLWVLRRGVEGGPAEASLCRFAVDSSMYRVDPSCLSVTQNPFLLESSLRYDGRTGGRRWAILGDLIASFVIAPHEELTRCWREVIRREMSPTEYERFFRIGLIEEEIFSLAERWSEPSFARERIRLMNRWTEAARRRYGAVFEGG
jgi:ABC-type Fe3+ transport system substrate-binding protein